MRQIIETWLKDAGGFEQPAMEAVALLDKLMEEATEKDAWAFYAAIDARDRYVQGRTPSPHHGRTTAARKVALEVVQEEARAILGHDPDLSYREVARRVAKRLGGKLSAESVRRDLRRHGPGPMPLTGG